MKSARSTGGQVRSGKIKAAPKRRRQECESNQNRLKKSEQITASLRMATLQSKQRLAKYAADSRKRVDEAMRIWKGQVRIHPSHVHDPSREADLIKVLGSQSRFSAFKILAEAYLAEPSIEIYLQARREFPEVDLDVRAFGGIYALHALEPELKKHDIDCEIALGALDAFEPDIDKLSLKLMELLVGREGLPKEGPGHLDLRANAVKDSFVDFLIVIMLEAIEQHQTKIGIPSSLIQLVRHRLCGSLPNIRQTHKALEDRQRAVTIAAELFAPDEKVSVRKFAKAVGVDKNVALEWLRDEGFKRAIGFARLRIESIKRVCSL